MAILKLGALNVLIAKSLRQPRAFTSAMRDSIRADPTASLDWLVYTETLVEAMVRAYVVGFRANGMKLNDSQRAAKRGEYQSKARAILEQYEDFGNRELDRAYTKAIDEGRTHAQATVAVLRRFNTLGMTSPASTRMAELYTLAMDGSFEQGTWDASQGDGSVIGFRYVTRGDDRVRHPVHTQYEGFSAPKDDPIWRTAFPPIDYGCRCKIQALKRIPSGGWVAPPSNPAKVTSGFQSTGFELS